MTNIQDTDSQKKQAKGKAYGHNAVMIFVYIKCPI